MSKIENILKNKKSLIAYITAGDESMNDTKSYILEMEKAGVDLVEIGIPFSDPTAQGDVVERANLRALKNADISINMIFDMIDELRKESDIPLMLLSYANPLLTYGYEEFFKDCKKHNILAVLVADIPYEEISELKEYSDKYEIDLIMTITPTNKERIEKIVKVAKGFILLQAAINKDDTKDGIISDIRELASEIKKIKNIPIIINADVNNSEEFNEFCEYTDGVLVDNLIVELLEKNRSKETVYNYVKSIKS